ncbi:MAG: hypothetical protein ABJA74_04350 [Lapillicoccus sp.]
MRQFSEPDRWPAVDLVLSAEGARLARRLSGEVRRSPSPMTGALTGAEQRRLRTLLERLVDPHRA